MIHAPATQLDELFDKDVMNAATWFVAHDAPAGIRLAGAESLRKLACYVLANIDCDNECTVSAHNSMGRELARIRIKLQLSVEKVKERGQT